MSDASDRVTLLVPELLADGRGGQAVGGKAVRVQGDRIGAVGDAEALRKETPPGAEVLDLPGQCLTPGLIDSHTHLSLAGDGRSYAEMFSDTDEMMVLTGVMNLLKHRRAGITTIREHGARNRVGFALKEGLGRGYFPGPRMQVSGRPITCTGGHFHMCNETADGVDEIRKSVRRLVHEGADYIKIMASGGGTAGTDPGRASYSVDELHAAVHEAHHHSRLTAAHCRASESMRLAVEAGVDLIEHAEFLDPDRELRFDPKLAEMVAESGIWVSPTLQAWTRFYRIVELRERHELGTLHSFEAAELHDLEVRAKGRMDVMRRMLEFEGMKERVVPGTDSGVSSLAFGHLDYDLQLLTEVGFTPAEALVAATRLSAEAIGMGGEIGTVEKGKMADFAIFQGDPTQDVGVFSRVSGVYQGGVKVV